MNKLEDFFNVILGTIFFLGVVAWVIIWIADFTELSMGVSIFLFIFVIGGILMFFASRAEKKESAKEKREEQKHLQEIEYQKRKAAAFEKKRLKAEKLAEEKRLKDEAEAEEMLETIRKEQIYEKATKQIELVVNAFRTIKPNDVSSILTSTADKELAKLLPDDVVEVLKTHQDLLEKLDLCYDDMHEKGVSDRFLIATFDKLRAKLNSNNGKDIKLIVTNT
jgi:cbb3-type cytochrome oxidase subunit 3